MRVKAQIQRGLKVREAAAREGQLDRLRAEQLVELRRTEVRRDRRAKDDRVVVQVFGKAGVLVALVEIDRLDAASAGGMILERRVNIEHHGAAQGQQNQDSRQQPGQIFFIHSGLLRR